MYFDALTVAAVVDELRQTILGGRIQHVVLSSASSIGLEVYAAGRRHHVLLSANPKQPRLHLVSAKLSRGVDDEPQLLLLLRKYVRNGVITAIEQPELERIAIVSITKYAGSGKDDDDEGDEELRCELVVEMLGPRANIILVDDNNVILDAIKRQPAERSDRVVMPRQVYSLPPRPAGRLDPRTATHGGVGEAFARGADPAKGLTAVYAGVSPLLAREALARAAGRPDQARAVAEALRSLYADPFAPCLAWEGDVPVAFAAYHLTHYGDVRQVATMSEALDTFYASAERLTAHAQQRERLLQRLADVRSRYARQHEALERELARGEMLERLRWEGEMIYAFLHALAPGQSEFEVEDRQITLDPSKTPVENARARFREYDKAKGALAGVPSRLAETQAMLQYLDETASLLDLADNWELIASIERELGEQGLLERSTGKAKGPRAAPLRLRSSEGVPILVGRSALQNDEVTFRLARPDDLWLHARGVPGAHVVVQADGPLGDATILEAAGLAAYFSKARGSTSAEVALCPRRNVRKVPGGPPGLVTIRDERSVRVPPLAPEELAGRGRTGDGL